jgi:hypothetical protein
MLSCHVCLRTVTFRRPRDVTDVFLGIEDSGLEHDPLMTRGRQGDAIAQTQAYVRATIEGRGEGAPIEEDTKTAQAGNPAPERPTASGTRNKEIGIAC